MELAAQPFATLLLQDQLLAFVFLLSLFVGPVVLIWILSRVRIPVPSLPRRKPKPAQPAQPAQPARIRSAAPPITTLLTGGAATMIEHPVFGSMLILVTIVGVMFQPLRLPWWVGAVLVAPMVVFLVADVRRVTGGRTAS